MGYGQDSTEGLTTVEHGLAIHRMTGVIILIKEPQLH